MNSRQTMAFLAVQKGAYLKVKNMELCMRNLIISWLIYALKMLTKSPGYLIIYLSEFESH